MRKPLLLTAVAAAAALAASCGGAGAPTATTTNRNSNAPAGNAQTSIQHGPSANANLGVAPAHGGEAGQGAGAGPAAPPAKAPVETPELDAKIEKAAAKAKAGRATPADRKAAAAAYLERGNFYYSAGNPMLYRYALGDFRRVLRFDPDNAEAKGKVKQIEDIYTYSIHKPIPDNGLNEP
ncbi:MAG TPA: hypothetical protein VF736_17460 [Pyrinomonadaceae bacterium]|jgi:hypothetical protein